MDQFSKRTPSLALLFVACSIYLWAIALQALAQPAPEPAPKLVAAQATVRMDVNKPGLTDTSETNGMAAGDLLITNQGTSAVSGIVVSGVYSDGTSIQVKSSTADGAGATSLESNASLVVNLSFQWTHTKPDTGWFIVEDESGKAPPITVPFQIRELVPGSIFLRIALYSALGALLVSFYLHRSLTNHPPATPPGGPGWDTKIYPSASWSFKDSWASNLTTTGAILGTVLAASGFLTDVLPGLSTGMFLGVSLAYGFLALLAPVVYTALLRQGAPIYGAVLVAGTITVWGTVGGIATVALLIGRGGVPVEWGIAGGIVLLVTVARYARSTVAQLLTPPPASPPGPPPPATPVGATAAIF